MSKMPKLWACQSFAALGLSELWSLLFLNSLVIYCLSPSDGRQEDVCIQAVYSLAVYIHRTVANRSSLNIHVY